MKKIVSVLLMFFLFLTGFSGENAPAVSILGDSYSTFRGSIPKGNSIWYPNKNNDVKKVEEAVNKEIVTTPTSIRKGVAGNYSGMIGIALLAMERGV